MVSQILKVGWEFLKLTVWTGLKFPKWEHRQRMELQEQNPMSLKLNYLERRRENTSCIKSKNQPHPSCQEYMWTCFGVVILWSRKTWTAHRIAELTKNWTMVHKENVRPCEKNVIRSRTGPCGVTVTQNTTVNPPRSSWELRNEKCYIGLKAWILISLRGCGATWNET